QENFYGVEIIATAIDNLINDTDFIKKAPISINLLITSILVITGISLIYLFRFKFPESYINLYSSLILIMLAYLVFNLCLFVKLSYWADLIFPEIVYIIVISAIIIVTSLIDKDKRSQVENTFSKYVSPQVYKALLENYSKVSLTAERMTVTVLFSDIRGFTTFSEELYPEQVARYLNEYFNEMVKVILKYNGTVDKFMGDAIMAFFGAPLPDENHCLNAIKAAIEMNESLDKLNDKWYKIGKKTLNIGIGINTGQALVGNFGSDQLMDFTVIGDTVNLASRLESLNKQENTNILISAFTYKHIKDKVNVNIIGPRTVKGKTESVVVYEVLNIKPD
ncbi:MAG: adenylate/guanylate cyclase domain-containing protein, partial [Cyanobacteriota bacterium]